MPDCGVHYLWFAFVCFSIRSPPPTPPGVSKRWPGADSKNAIFSSWFFCPMSPPSWPDRRANRGLVRERSAQADDAQRMGRRSHTAYAAPSELRIARRRVGRPHAQSVLHPPPASAPDAPASDGGDGRRAGGHGPCLAPTPCGGPAVTSGYGSFHSPSSLAAGFQLQYDLELDPVPDPGKFNVEEVLQSEYFFS